jgi:hypothetical protein
VSASGSLDGQLSAYTGVSVNGQGSISGLSVSGNGGNGGALGLSGLSGSFSNDRVATPPLLGGHSYANRPKATTGVYWYTAWTFCAEVLMLALDFPCPIELALIRGYLWRAFCHLSFLIMVLTRRIWYCREPFPQRCVCEPKQWRRRLRRSPGGRWSLRQFGEDAGLDAAPGPGPAGQRKHE